MQTDIHKIVKESDATDWREGPAGYGRRRLGFLPLPAEEAKAR